MKKSTVLKTVYYRGPVRVEDKRRVNAAGYRLIDARFAPDDWDMSKQEDAVREILGIGRVQEPVTHFDGYPKRLDGSEGSSASVGTIEGAEGAGQSGQAEQPAASQPDQEQPSAPELSGSDENTPEKPEQVKEDEPAKEPVKRGRKPAADK